MIYKFHFSFLLFDNEHFLSETVHYEKNAGHNFNHR